MSVHRGGRGPGHISRRAAAAVSGHTYGPEWSPDPGFDTPADWSLLNSATISASVLTLSSSALSRASATAGNIFTTQPPSGSYLITFSCNTVPSGQQLKINFAGAIITVPVTQTGANQTYLATGVVPTGTGLTIGSSVASELGAYDSISIMQQLT